ncbi:MAG: CPBP family intramembrane metalloprotease [Oscillospiraceae bacterium]|nr:CPBP family intramembrane metalloprotease [Oscillospiraceae bacterium]
MMEQSRNREKLQNGIRLTLRILRGMAVAMSFLMLVCVILDIWLDAETKTWNWLLLDLLGLPLCGLLLWDLLRCTDLRRCHARLAPVVLLILLFGGYASYISWVLLVVLLLPLLFIRAEKLPEREERPEAPRMAWLMLLVTALILYNFETLMHIMGFRWTLQDGLAEIGTLLYPAAIVTLCVAPLALRLKDDWLIFVHNTEAYAQRTVPVMLLAGSAFVAIRFFHTGAVDFTAAVARPYDVALPLTIVAGVLLQPAAEELIYRGVLRRVIRSRWVFLAAGALLYGLLRAVTQTGGVFLLQEFLAYTVLGLGFSACYAMTDNFFVAYAANACMSLIAVLAGLPMLQN